MKTSLFGYSTQGLPIMSYHSDSLHGPKVLLLGGVHGDEPEGVAICTALINNPEFKQLQLQTTTVPTFNIDGILLHQRTNGRNIDLNRNLPTKDWTPEILNPRYPPGPSANSEPENQALTKYITSWSPQYIISFHSWKPLLNPNGNCDPWVQIIAKEIGYSVEPSIGYATPGSLGTYAGSELGIPTLTYEIQEGLSFSEIVKTHIPATLKALKYLEAPHD